MKRKIILSASRDLTRKYAAENNLSPKDYIEVLSSNDLRGTTPETNDLVELGSWQHGFLYHNYDELWNIKAELFNREFWENK